MKDRELLEMAAKAAGIQIEFDEASNLHWVGDRFSSLTWDPLHSDGDALRLANRLCMMLSTGPCQATASTISGALRGYFPKECTISQDQDKAVRRVIVLAAAEIGRAMP